MVYKLESNHRKTNALRISLLTISFALIVSAYFITWLLILLGAYFLIMPFLIKTKTIKVFSDRFELHGNSWLHFFNSKETFEYHNIESIKFDKNYTSLVAEIIYDSAFTPITSSKPDTIEIVMKDETFRTINRFGKKGAFINCFRMIFKEINKSTIANKPQ